MVDYYRLESRTNVPDISTFQDKLKIQISK